MKAPKSGTANTTGDLDTHDVTSEVGSEGGSFGNVERGVTRDIGAGSEAGETWQPAEREQDELSRDETGQGRRNP